MNKNEEISCLSTSEYWEDVKGHFQIWQPDVYVCLIEDKNSLQIPIIKNLSESLVMAEVPVVIVTNEEFYPYFAGGLYDNVALVLKKPITKNEIFNNITDMLSQRRIEKHREETERIRLQKEAEALAEANRTKSILVVDDDKNVLKLLKGALEDKYNVSTMITGKMAEKFLESKSCDLILLDYEMPVENGPEVFKKIKTMESAKDIPIIFLTGVAEKDKIAEVLMLKPQGYLLKPIDMDKLRDLIEKNIG